MTCRPGPSDCASLREHSSIVSHKKARGPIATSVSQSASSVQRKAEIALIVGAACTRVQSGKETGGDSEGLSNIHRTLPTL
jgi:hypothetical protein